jgi:Uma2 family endonuclease
MPDTYLARRPIGELSFAPVDVYLSERDVVQPDLLFISNARRGIIAEDGVHGAPDLVIEILPPSTAPLDEGSKRRVYALSGVKELWLVDPLENCIRKWRFDENPNDATEFGVTTVMRSIELPGFELSVAGVFRR